MAHIATELTWLKHFLQEIDFSTPTPIPLSCDNQATIHIASNLVFHERTKHIKVNCHYVEDKILDGDNLQHL